MTKAQGSLFVWSLSEDVTGNDTSLSNITSVIFYSVAQM